MGFGQAQGEVHFLKGSSFGGAGRNRGRDGDGTRSAGPQFFRRGDFSGSTEVARVFEREARLYKRASGKLGYGKRMIKADYTESSSNPILEDKGGPDANVRRTGAPISSSTMGETRPTFIAYMAWNHHEATKFSFPPTRFSQ